MNKHDPTLAHTRPKGHTLLNILFCTNEPNLCRVASHPNRLAPSVLRTRRAGLGTHTRTQNQTQLSAHQSHFWSHQTRLLAVRMEEKMGSRFRGNDRREQNPEERLRHFARNDESGDVKRSQRQKQRAVGPRPWPRHALCWKTTCAKAKRQSRR